VRCPAVSKYTVIPFFKMDVWYFEPRECLLFPQKVNIADVSIK